MAAYALDWNSIDPVVASGGRDRQILLWNVDAYFNTSGKIPEEEKETYSPGRQNESSSEASCAQAIQPDNNAMSSA